MQYSLPKEYYRFISRLNPACRFISEAGSPVSLPHYDKSLEHCLLGKLSETLKTAMVCTCAEEAKTERKIRNNRKRRETMTGRRKNMGEPKGEWKCQ